MVVLDASDLSETYFSTSFDRTDWDVLSSDSFADSTINYDSGDEKETCSLSASSSSESLSSSSQDISSPVTCIPYLPEESLFKLDDESQLMEPERRVCFERKRKDRNESSGSLEQEIKVIRASESPLGSTSASTSLQEQQNSEHISETGPSNSTSTGIYESEIAHSPKVLPVNFEPEVQRQWERTDRQWHTRKLKRHRPKHTRSSKSFSEIEDAIRSNYSNLEELSISTPATRGRSSSNPKPTIQEDLEMTDEDSRFTLSPLPSLDLSTLHHQIDSEVPLLCTGSQSRSDQAMLSPRNSVIVSEEIEKIPPSPPLYQQPISREDDVQDSRVSHLTRHISQLKRQIKVLEIEHEQIFGYKPSHSDKLNHKEMKKCVLFLNKAKRDLKRIKEEGRLSADVQLKPFVPSTNTAVDSFKSLETSVREIEKQMQENRNSNHRSEDPGMMSQTELCAEKNLLQDHLLTLENRYGRPNTEEEKQVVRGLYERYRIIKRMTCRSFSTKENSLDLVPILEYETLELSNEEVSIRGSSDEIPEQETIPGSSTAKYLTAIPSTHRGNLSREFSVENEDYSDMGLEELQTRYRRASDEKRKLRTCIRSIEDEITNSTGRSPQKEDRYSSPEMEKVYRKYKHVRATLRLLDVLINKRKYPIFSDAD